jgi:hypothetical protein
MVIFPNKKRGPSQIQTNNEYSLFSYGSLDKDDKFGKGRKKKIKKK